MDIASAFVGPLVEITINKMISYVERQMKWRKDFEAGLYKIKISLLMIKSVAASMETAQLTYEQNQLLLELKKAVYEADDFLDEFAYDLLEKEAKKHTKTPNLCSFLRREAISARNFGKRLIGKDEMHNNLVQILNQLNDVNKIAKQLAPVVGPNVNPVSGGVEIPKNRLTSSYVKEKEIFGRDDQKEELVGILTKTSDDPKNGDKNKIAVIALVGEGGIGKTTLAQHVYNDDRINDRFELRIWICVSTSSDKVRLTKEILEGAFGTSETHKDITNYNILVNKLEEELKSRNFLLVLDDIWYDEKLTKFDNESHWRELLAPLQVGDSRSKIVVTTREIRIAETLKATNCIQLQGLAHDDYWLLFRKCAFGDLNPIEHPKLEHIGTEIAKRLKGLPLAAYVVGGMLRCKLEASYWKYVLERGVFDDVFKTLKLSYDSLPKHLKPCFFYCGIFPKDWKFDPDDLVPLWVAQGYVQTQNDEPTGMIVIGKIYFDDLVSRSFFQPTEDDSPRYVMHDLIHDLARTVSGGECLLIDDIKQKKTPNHLGILSKTQGTNDNLVMQQLKESCKLQDLRTFVCFSSTYVLTSTLTDVFDELKSARAVVIYGRDFSVMEVEVLMNSLANKKHLRYLNLHGTWLSIPRLYHLQILRMGKGGSRMLNEGLAHLKRFGNLIVCKGNLEFEVEREKGFGICKKESFVCELKNFVDVLHGDVAILNLQNIYNMKEAQEVEIGRGQHIIKLTLQWNLPRSTSISNSIIFEDVIEGLQSHRNLRELYIENYGGIRLPDWLEKNEFNDEIIQNNNGNISFYNSFPMLEHLAFINMPELSELNGKNWNSIFPCLERLTIKRCPNLMEVHLLRNHLLLRKLNHLEVEDVGDLPSFSLKISTGNTKKLALSIYSAPSKVLPILHSDHLTGIKELVIDGRRDKENMAGLDLSVLSSLHDLRFTNRPSLPNLRSRKGGFDQKSSDCILPSSLDSLRFVNCGSTDVLFWRCLQGLPSLKRLFIWHFKFLQSDIAGSDINNRIPCAELDSLKIWTSDLTDRSLSECLLNIANVSDLDLGSCNRLTCLPSADVLHRLTALRKLEIRRCHELISLGGSNALVNVRKMMIISCPKLKSLPDEGLPASIKSLTIAGCHPQLMQQVKEKTGPQWNKISHIPNITTDWQL